MKLNDFILLIVLLNFIGAIALGKGYMFTESSILLVGINLLAILIITKKQETLTESSHKGRCKKLVAAPRKSESKSLNKAED